MTLVKICGIADLETARAALARGADMLGFHIELEHGRNPIAPERAAEIILQLPESCTSVAVTSIIDPARIIELAKKTGVRAVQFHGDALEMRKIKSELPQLKLLKVVNVLDESAVAEAKGYEGVADALVLDSAIRENGQKGGTGKTHDWSISEKIVKAVSIPVILAGGLNPDNVSEAISRVHPYGVDVNSGVSNSDGTKDLEKVNLFIEKAR